MKITYILLLVAIVAIISPGIMADPEADKFGQAKKTTIFNEVDKVWKWILNKLEG
ncbi:hypothetical protein PUN28_001229 [Cardiocondyla obscurior]|uniref:Uncharacterized protein n=1 Tax=Cardiocondyla obscurior TaxID=286306 RepID=A0AAW2H3X6_9HYME